MTHNHAPQPQQPHSVDSLLPLPRWPRLCGLVPTAGDSADDRALLLSEGVPGDAGELELRVGGVRRAPPPEPAVGPDRRVPCFNTVAHTASQMYTRGTHLRVCQFVGGVRNCAQAVLLSTLSTRMPVVYGGVRWVGGRGGKPQPPPHAYERVE